MIEPKAVPSHKGPNWNSPGNVAAEASLAEELRPVFRDLFEDYVYAAQECHGRGYVSPRVIAALVRQGWRKGVAS